jgi:hypothetical protein
MVEKGIPINPCRAESYWLNNRITFARQKGGGEPMGSTILASLRDWQKHRGAGAQRSQGRHYKCRQAEAV